MAIVDAQGRMDRGAIRAIVPGDDLPAAALHYFLLAYRLRNGNVAVEQRQAEQNQGGQKSHPRTTGKSSKQICV